MNKLLLYTLTLCPSKIEFKYFKKDFKLEFYE